MKKKIIAMLFCLLFLSCAFLPLGKKEGYIITGNITTQQMYPKIKNKGCMDSLFVKKILDYFYNHQEYSKERFWCIMYSVESKSCVGLYALQYDYTHVIAQWNCIPVLVFEDKLVMNTLWSDTLLISQATDEFEARYKNRFSYDELKKIREVFFGGEISHYADVSHRQGQKGEMVFSH